MQAPSRYMLKRDDSNEVGFIGVFIVSLIFLSPIIFALAKGKYFTEVVFIYSVFFIVCFVVFIRRRKHFDKLKLGRENDSICTFARHFERYEVDTWVIRTVFEELTSYCPDIPIRPADNIFDDLMIDPDDFEIDFKNDIVGDIAKRSCRSLKGFKNNPYFGKAGTVEGLVHFFNNQPKEKTTQE